MRKSHTIEMIFPKLLFILFSLCALFLMTAGVKSYLAFNQQCESDMTTALAYIKTKVDMNNDMDNIDIGTIDDTPCLMLKDIIQEETYITYIYVYNDQLTELWIPENEIPQIAAGTPFMEMKSISFHFDKKTLQLEINDLQNHRKQLVLYVNGGLAL